MANRSIIELANFEPFINLEVLWLNNNSVSISQCFIIVVNCEWATGEKNKRVTRFIVRQIADLYHLDRLTRLKQLYAHNNQIISINNCKFRSKFLASARSTLSSCRFAPKLTAEYVAFVVLRRTHYRWKIINCAI